MNLASFSWIRISMGIVSIGLAIFLYLVPFAKAPDNAVFGILLHILLISILVGILPVLVLMLGDLRAFYPGSWRVMSAYRRQIRRALNRFVILFSIYFGIVTLALVGVLLDTHAPWVKRVAVSLGSVALLWSFAIPWMIRKTQLAKLDTEVERRKIQARNGDRK